MTRIEEIDKELTDLRRQLAEVQGTETEVYTRIVGYYRSLRNWNKGKKEEYRHRLPFVPQDTSREEIPESAEDWAEEGLLVAGVR